jgi:hypothetical protein
MFVRIDDEDLNFEGYSYLNLDDEEETVKYTYDKYCSTCVISAAYTSECEIYVGDIPKLIKALEAIMKLDKEKSI